MTLVRSVTVASLLHWEDAGLLHLLAAYSLSEQSGKWQDRRSSSTFLRGNTVGELVGCDAVRVTGPNTFHNADRGDVFFKILRENNIGELVGCDAVRVIGPNTLHNADRGDVFVVAPKRS